jgi:hypothetical protein
MLPATIIVLQARDHKLRIAREALDHRLGNPCGHVAADTAVDVDVVELLVIREGDLVLLLCPLIVCVAGRRSPKRGPTGPRGRPLTSTAPRRGSAH